MLNIKMAQKRMSKRGGVKTVEDQRGKQKTGDGKGQQET